jgi:hypothetical protein
VTDPGGGVDAERVDLHLSTDEALVLFDFLTRGQNRSNDYSVIADQSELRVLWDIQATLEATLEAVVMPEYDALVAAARARVRDEPF